jgi:hypothetical protein
LPCLLPFTQSLVLKTQSCLSLAAAILPQLLLRHPPPQQIRRMVAPKCPFFAFCRSCQVLRLPIFVKRDVKLKHLQNFTQIHLDRKECQWFAIGKNCDRRECLWYDRRECFSAQLPLPKLTTFANVTLSKNRNSPIVAISFSSLLTQNLLH